MWGIVIGAVLASGCSAIGVRGPRTSPTTHEVVCEQSYVAPVLDAAIALAGVALIVWGATAETDPEGHVVTGRNFAEYPGFAMALPFSVSSVYGFVTVAGCKRAAGG